MMLYINGQDIRSFAIGFTAPEGSSMLKIIQETSPEKYLQHIHDFLKDNDASVSEIEKLYAVVGPGSATALRTTLSIVNTIAFVSEVELIGVVKSQEEQDEVTISNIRSEKAELIRGKEQLDAIYEHGPRITVSKKDQLKRPI